MIKIENMEESISNDMLDGKVDNSDNYEGEGT